VDLLFNEFGRDHLAVYVLIKRWSHTHGECFLQESDLADILNMPLEHVEPIIALLRQHELLD
jgi:hypothetical protein